MITKAIGEVNFFNFMKILNNFRVSWVKSVYYGIHRVASLSQGREIIQNIKKEEVWIKE